MDFRTIIKEYAETPISRHLILEILSEYQSPNDKISELLKSKELISIRRGLYITGPKMDFLSPQKENQLLNPKNSTYKSFISLTS